MGGLSAALDHRSGDAHEHQVWQITWNTGQRATHRHTDMWKAKHTLVGSPGEDPKEEAYGNLGRVAESS